MGDYAWYRKNALDIGEKYAHRVGIKDPNPWGLYDMHGNVWEWCQDWHDENYYYQSSELDPKGPSSGKSRVLRGGSWNYHARSLRSASRDRLLPHLRYFYNGGLRVAMTATGAIAKTPPEQKYKPIVSKANEIERDGRFIAYANGTVKETKTGLMWAAKDNGEDINWQNAKRYCENYRGGGYNDWRTPTVKELRTLYRKGKGERNMTPLLKTTGWGVWSGEIRDSSSA